MPNQKKNISSQFIEKGSFTIDELNLGISKLDRRIKELENLVLEKPAYNSGIVTSIKTKIRTTVQEIFGEKSRIYNDTDGSEIQPRYGEFYFGGGSPAEYQQEFEKSLPLAIDKLAGFREMLVEKLNDLQQNVKESGMVKGTRKSTSKSVFIMHGHDEHNLTKLKELLREDWKLNPIVMKDHPPLGMQHLLHKFEELAKECSYAIALFSKDDFLEKPDSTGSRYRYFQGRPNVIFELGWFTGFLGHDRVTLLVQKDTNIPSDLLGIEELRFKEDIHEQYRMLQKGLQKAKLIAEHS